MTTKQKETLIYAFQIMKAAFNLCKAISKNTDYNKKLVSVIKICNSNIQILKQKELSEIDKINILLSPNQINIILRSPLSPKNFVKGGQIIGEKIKGGEIIKSKYNGIK